MVLFGIFFVDKFMGLISYDVVVWIWWVFGIWKVGYVGMFDLMVIGFFVFGIEGVMWLFIYIVGVDKMYEVMICFG